jgi:bisphosphoglycerate-independent phosphoglycerate mutase (AlkP superfamily)
LRSFSVRSKTEEAKAYRLRTDGSLRDISPALLNLLNLGLPKR